MYEVQFFGYPVAKCETSEEAQTVVNEETLFFVPDGKESSGQRVTVLLKLRGKKTQDVTAQFTETNVTVAMDSGRFAD